MKINGKKVRKADVEALVEVAAAARHGFRLTREYVGEQLLPAQEGWSWWDSVQSLNEALAPFGRGALNMGRGGPIEWPFGPLDSPNDFAVFREAMEQETVAHGGAVIDEYRLGEPIDVPDNAPPLNVPRGGIRWVEPPMGPTPAPGQVWQHPNHGEIDVVAVAAGWAWYVPSGFPDAVPMTCRLPRDGAVYLRTKASADIPKVDEDWNFDMADGTPYPCRVLAIHGPWVWIWPRRNLEDSGPAPSPVVAALDQLGFRVDA